MRAQAVQDVWNTGYNECGVRFADEIISESREILDVVEVEMRQQDMADLHLLGQGQPGPDGAGIQENGVIDQEGAGSALHGTAVTVEKLIGTMTAQHADFHSNSFRLSEAPRVRALATNNPFPNQKNDLQICSYEL